jgi:hypothetical protein
VLLLDRKRDVDAQTSTTAEHEESWEHQQQTDFENRQLSKDGGYSSGEQAEDAMNSGSDPVSYYQVDEPSVGPPTPPSEIPTPAGRFQRQYIEEADNITASGIGGRRLQRQYDFEGGPFAEILTQQQPPLLIHQLSREEARQFFEAQLQQEQQQQTQLHDQQTQMQLQTQLHEQQTQLQQLQQQMQPLQTLQAPPPPSTSSSPSYPLSPYFVFLNPAFQESALQGRPVFSLEGSTAYGRNGEIFTIPSGANNGFYSQPTADSPVLTDKSAGGGQQDDHLPTNDQSDGSAPGLPIVSLMESEDGDHVMPQINNFMEDTDHPDYASLSGHEVNNLMENDDRQHSNDALEGRRYLMKRAALPGLFGGGGRYGYRGHRHHHHGHGHGHGHGFRFPYFG